MTRNLMLGLVALTLTVPASAQKQQPTPEDRIYRLERQTRQLQKQVFPKGQPADTAGFDDAPAASQTVVVALSSRIDALERQLADATRLAEENGNRVATLETELARMKTDLDARLRQLETAGGAPAAGGEPAAVAERETSPVVTPSAPKPVITTTRTGNADADAEVLYDTGYQFWLQKRYPQAITALKLVPANFPGHRRVSWANNLIGRALLDSGQPRAAAEALLANYRGNPKGERAPDSLFYLGQALVALNQPQQACKAYAELEEVYGGSMRADLQKLLPPAKAKARC